FHVSLLEPAKGLYPGKTHPSPQPVNVQYHLEWEVSRILDARLCKGKLQYIVDDVICHLLKPPITSSNFSQILIFFSSTLTKKSSKI
ncbi:uncharacterized protein VP01_6590g1, partial [Puccinia sorghi]